jgi:hypothetical protein
MDVAHFLGNGRRESPTGYQRHGRAQNRVPDSEGLGEPRSHLGLYSNRRIRITDSSPIWLVQATSAPAPEAAGTG